MLNPNICKRVRVVAEPVVDGRIGKTQYAVLQNGVRLEVNELRHGFLKPGNRYAYLKYSICSDHYYLTARA